MPTKIMVAVHNASPGAGTFALATNWVQRLEGRIVGVGVVDESTGVPASVLAGGAASRGNIVPPDTEALRAKAYKGVAHALRELEEHCRQAGISYSQVEKADGAEVEIALEAQRCDVVLLGRKADPDIDFGVPARTILTGILRHSPRPVVAVPHHLQEGEGILAAYDGSLQAARALQALVASGLTGLGPVTVVGVDSRSRETAEEHAGRAVDYLAFRNFQVDSHTLVSDKSVEQVILEEARARGVELIVMGAYGRSRLAEFFLGSTTTKVMDGASAPVFLFH